MSNNQDLTWKAMCELGDYFSCLGGAARPFNMAESEIQLYIGYKVLQLNNVSIDENEYANPAFLKAANPVIEKVNAYLSEVNLLNQEPFPFVQEFYEFADKKLQAKDKTKRWYCFGEYLRHNKGQLRTPTY